ADRVERLRLGAVEEAAGIDDDEVRALVRTRELVALGAQPRDDALGIDQRLRAAERDEAHLGGGRGLRRCLFHHFSHVFLRPVILRRERSEPRRMIGPSVATKTCCNTSAVALRGPRGVYPWAGQRPDPRARPPQGDGERAFSAAAPWRQAPCSPP